MADLSKRDRETLLQMSLEDPRVLEQIRSTPRVPTARVPDSEGLGSFIDGLLVGDFSDNNTWSAAAGQTVGGFIPGVGQAADVRDLVAAISNQDALGIGLGAVGFIPGMDFLKSVFKRGKKMKKVPDVDPDKTIVRGIDDPEVQRAANRPRVIFDDDLHGAVNYLARRDGNEWYGMPPASFTYGPLTEYENAIRSLDATNPDDADILIDMINAEMRKAQGPLPWE